MTDHLRAINERLKGTMAELIGKTVAWAEASREADRDEGGGNLAEAV